MMDSDFWQQRWQAGQIGFHQTQVNEYLQQYWSQLPIQSNDGVLVPLCGKSKDMLWLAQQGHAVIGVELSELAVEAFFTEQALAHTVTTVGKVTRTHSETPNITLYGGDFFSMIAAEFNDVSAVFDRAALVALPPPLRQQYVQHLMTLLPELATILLVTMEYPPDEMNGPPFTVFSAEVEQLFSAYFDIEKLDTRNILAQEPHFQSKGLTEMREVVYLLRKK